MASRFPSRDRSPYRFNDRRQSNASLIPSGSRAPDDANFTPLGREPPRGPKALVDSHPSHSRGGSSMLPPAAPRGRGYMGRGEFRDRLHDRDFADSRDAPPPPYLKRDGDRDWPPRRDRAFESRDSRPPPPFARGRSRSPPPLRDFRDPDTMRIRRNSRDSGPMALGTMLPDFPPSRGSFRGRGRGDRGRGRGGSFLDDRARRRSRSREPWRDRPFYRDDRDRDRAVDRGIDRRARLDWGEEGKRTDREERRDRFSDRVEWRKDRQPPSRLNLKSPRPGSSPPASSAASLQGDERPGKPESSELSRRVSSFAPLPARHRERGRESERVSAPIPPRPDLRPVPSAARFLPQGQMSPPPAAPEVPAFGSVASSRMPKENAALGAGLAGPAAFSPQSAPKPLPAQLPSSPAPVPPKPNLARRVSLPILYDSGPPTAPKANRHELIPSRANQSEVTNSELRRLELSSSKALSASSPLASASSTSDQQAERTRSSASNATSFSPHLASATPSKSSNLIIGSAPSAASLPTGPSKSPGSQRSPRAAFSSVPTGPRALQRPGPPRAGPKASNQWIRPGYINKAASSAATSQNAGQQAPSTAPKLGFEERVSFVRPGQQIISDADGTIKLEETKAEDVAENPQKSKLSHEAGKAAKEVRASKTVATETTNLEEGKELKDTNSSETTQDAAVVAEERKKEVSQEVLQTSGQKKDISVASSLPQRPASQSDQPESNQQHTTATLLQPKIAPGGGVSPLGLSRSSGEESDEENGLDEDDFQEREAKFAKEMKALEADMPRPILENKEITDLLLKVQILKTLAANVDEAKSNQADEAMELDKVELVESKESIIPDSGERNGEMNVDTVLSAQAEEVAAGESASPSRLPFLRAGSPVPVTDSEVYRNNIQVHETIKNALQSEMSKQRHELWQRHESLRQEYARIYKTWRLGVMEMDRKKAREKALAASSPSSPPGTTESAILEGRRSYKLNSELDFQNALKASELSAQQEELERQREREETKWPDLSKEAVIPDMLDPKEREANLFKDTNQAVNPDDAIRVFAFYPEPDDFTPEEHKLFMEAFLQNPKKWGKIAEALPGRTYQHCIKHYYMTKLDVKYKAKLHKRVVKRRGRARQSKPPKSVALMADLGIRPDLEKAERETPAVTDTGRPRRAAAPTFGETPDPTDTGTPVPAPSRRGASKDIAEQPAEKPRRGRGGTRSRRTRTSQASTTPNAQSSTASAKPVNEAPGLEALEKQNVEVEKGSESTAVASTPQPRSRAGKPRTKTEGMSVFDSTEVDSALKQNAPYGSFQPTSYWSVPEVRDFPALVAHFGRDFEGISQFMKTKTPTMAKNYFQRQVDLGKKEFEDTANLADEQKMQGIPTAPLPVPSAPTKRRFDPASSTARPLRPSADVNEAVDVPVTFSPSQQAQMDADAHAQAHVQATLESKVLEQLPAASYRMHSHAPSALQMPIDEMSPYRHAMSPAQRGPRMGYFSDSRRSMRAQLAQASSIPPPIPQELLSVNRQPELVGVQNVARVGNFASPLARPDSLQHPIDSPDPHFHQQLSSSDVITQSPLYTSRPGSPRSVVAHSHSYAQPVSMSLARPHEVLPAPGSSANLPHSHFMRLGQQSPAASPKRDINRVLPTPTPLQRSEPRQVPAKRSNIVNILNDEPEEPQPRKRFASESTASMRTQASFYPTAKGPINPQQEAQMHHHLYAQEMSQSQSRARPSPMHTPVAASSRPFSNSPTYGSVPQSSMPPPEQDWYSRVDSRSQPGGQGMNAAEHHIPRLSLQPSSIEYLNQASQPNLGSGLRQSPRVHYPDVLQQQAPPPPPAFTSQPLHQSKHTSSREQAARASSAGMGSPLLAYQQHRRTDSPSHLHYSQQSLTGPPSPIQLSTASIGQRRRPSPVLQPQPYLLPTHHMPYGSHPVDTIPSQSPHPQHVLPSSPLHTPRLSNQAPVAPQAKRDVPSSLLGHITPSPSQAPLSRPASVLQASGGLAPLGLGRSYTPPAPLHPSSQPSNVLYPNMPPSHQRSGPLLHPMHPPSSGDSPPARPERHRSYQQER